MKKVRKAIVIGAGITGAVIARVLAENNYQVQIYEKRDHIGGNMYDYKNNGVLVHKYGPHIFHTSNEKVNSFMNQFWKLNSFKNVVEAYVQNKLVPIPFNFKSIDLCFEKEAVQIKELLLKEYPNQNSIPILELLKNKNRLIKKLATFVYENVFLNYTTKMWDLKPNEIDFSVTARIPIILSYANTYFHDKYEGLPEEGYTNTFKRILNHKNIKVILKKDIIQDLNFEKNQIFFKKDNPIIVYTGPLDKLFKNKFGSLEYRSLFFQFELLLKEKFQETAVVNYPAHPKMTRITEYKNMTFQKVKNKTVISKEFPGAFSLRSKKWNEPYYPLATQKAREKYQQYFELSQKYKNLYIAGRMALYKYLNMDQAIEFALELSKKIINENKN